MGDTIEALERLARLRESGALSEAEYEAEKRKLLAGASGRATRRGLVGGLAAAAGLALAAVAVWLVSRGGAPSAPAANQSNAVAPAKAVPPPPAAPRFGNVYRSNDQAWLRLPHTIVGAAWVFNDREVDPIVGVTESPGDMHYGAMNVVCDAGNRLLTITYFPRNQRFAMSARILGIVVGDSLYGVPGRSDYDDEAGQYVRAEVHYDSDLVAAFRSARQIGVAEPTETVMLEATGFQAAMSGFLARCIR